MDDALALKIMKMEDYTFCPYIQDACVKHKCALYVQIIGHNPNTGEQMNKAYCSIRAQVDLTIENSQQQRATGAAVESFRNEMVRDNARGQAILAQAVERANIQAIET